MIRIANKIEGLNGGVRPKLDDIYEHPNPADIAALLQPTDVVADVSDEVDESASTQPIGTLGLAVGAGCEPRSRAQQGTPDP